MFQRLKKIFALFMVLAVLVSSHSFAYFEHLCTITKVKTLSFNLETCAGEYLPINEIQDFPSISKGDCCNIDFKVNQADNAIQHQLDLKVNIYNLILSQIPNFQFKAEYAIMSNQIVHYFADSSPPLKQAIYILNQQFII